MPNFRLFKHAIDQIILRGLTIDTIEAVLFASDRVLEEGNKQQIYQALIEKENKEYLLRVFVNGDKIPMKMKYDKETDILYISLSSEPVAESDEDKPGIILDYAVSGTPVGSEFLNASKKILKPGAIEVELV